jgi:hypothetical protein
MGASPPYDISSDSLFVSFASDAEMSCHLAMGWKLPARVLDLRIEFLQAINVTPRPARGKGEKERWGSLLHALNYYGLDSMGGVEKEQMREVILRGEPALNAERGKVLDYCEADVLALCRLLPAMIRRGHIHLDRRLHFALQRSLYAGSNSNAASRCSHRCESLQSSDSPMGLNKAATDRNPR